MKREREKNSVHARRVTFTMYVPVVDASCAVTKIVTMFEPTFKEISKETPEVWVFPFTLIEDVESVTVGVIDVDNWVFSTVEV